MKQSQETITKRSKSNTGKVKSNETRNNISKGKMGIKFSTEHIQKLKDRVVTEETKTKIRLARSKQVFTEETKIKLSGCVVVVDKTGLTSKITKSEYELQKLIPFEESQYVAHRSKEGIRRISMRR